MGCQNITISRNKGYVNLYRNLLRVRQDKVCAKKRVVSNATDVARKGRLYVLIRKRQRDALSKTASCSWSGGLSLR